MRSLHVFISLTQVLVGTGSLIAISGAHHCQVRDETQRWDGLDGLMGRAILSDLSLTKILKESSYQETDKQMNDSILNFQRQKCTLETGQTNTMELFKQSKTTFMNAVCLMQDLNNPLKPS